MSDHPLPTGAQENQWDVHWKALDETLSVFSLLSGATRRLIFQPAVAFYANQFFRKTGTFVEMGCGTAESSATIARDGRQLVGLDFSAEALRAAQQVGRMDRLIQANIFSTPFRSQSLDGIWNLGVMEHFTQSQIRTCLREFRRVLKPGAVMLLFWPAERNASRWVLGPLELIIRRWRGTDFTFFPDEISRLESKQHARILVESEGFKVNTIDFDWRTAFIHMVIVATAQ